CLPPSRLPADAAGRPPRRQPLARAQEGGPTALTAGEGDERRQHGPEVRLGTERVAAGDERASAALVDDDAALVEEVAPAAGEGEEVVAVVAVRQQTGGTRRPAG